MRRFFNKDFNKESDFSWKSTVYTAIAGVLIAAALSGFGWMVNRCLRFEALEKQVTSLEIRIDEQYKILHMRINKEQETRTDEFESLVGRQLSIIAEQNKILYDLHKGK